VDLAWQKIRADDAGPLRREIADRLVGTEHDPLRAQLPDRKLDQPGLRLCTGGVDQHVRAGSDVLHDAPAKMRHDNRLVWVPRREIGDLR
jgi:hypothetical protein